METARGPSGLLCDTRLTVRGGLIGLSIWLSWIFVFAQASIIGVAKHVVINAYTSSVVLCGVIVESTSVSEFGGIANACNGHKNQEGKCEFHGDPKMKISVIKFSEECHNLSIIFENQRLPYTKKLTFNIRKMIDQELLAGRGSLGAGNWLFHSVKLHYLYSEKPQFL